MNTAPPVVQRIDYHAMRMRRFRAALVSFGRRWALYGATFIVVFGAGSNAPVAITVGLASGLVWPLRVAATHGWALVPAIVGYAMVGALPVVLTRPLWWPRGWAAAERALPLPPATVRRSDRRFALLMMVPWQGLLGLGFFGTLEGGTADRWLAGAGWIVSMAGSLRLASWWMRSIRERAGTKPAAGRSGSFERTRRPDAVRPLGVRRALLILPMRRGRADRSAGALVGGLVVTVACAGCSGWSGLSIAWACALAALAASCATAFLRAATARELQPLWQNNRHLPLAGRACEHTRHLLVLTPMAAGLLTSFATAAAASEPFRPQVLVLYAAVLASGCIAEALTPPTTKPQDHAARWLLLLVAAIAFASEIPSS